MESIPFSEKEAAVKASIKLFNEAFLEEDEVFSENMLNIYYILQAVYYNYVDNLQDYRLSRKIEPKSNLSIAEKAEIVENFFKEYGLPFSIEKCINNGTFDIEVYDYENSPTQYYDTTLGITRIRAGHCYCDCEDHQTLYDTTSWVHELGHYANITNDEPINKLLTESLSFTLSLLYSDYLREKGYEEAQDFLIIDYLNNFSVLDDYMAYILFVALHNELGTIDADGLALVFGNGHNYEAYIEYAYDSLCKESIDDFFWNVLTAIRYALAQMISIYNFERVKENPAFIENIIDYNDRIYDPESLEDTLEAIELPKINSVAFFNKTNEYLSNHTDRLKSMIEEKKNRQKHINK